MKVEISDPRHIHIDNFNYNLPEDKIAKYPIKERDRSKLLVCKPDKLIDSNFYLLPNYLPENSLLVFNNTKVIQARMHFRKSTGALIEIFCLEPYSPNDYALNFQQTSHCSWVCLVGNLKKWKEGKLVRNIIVEGRNVCIEVSRREAYGDSHIIDFEWDDPEICFSTLLDIVGELPIPPYLNRDTEEQDKETYQTVYSKIEGSVAAPTAGLHFTNEVFADLKNKGMETTEVTLHVGAGTFKPVKSEEIKDHEMHSEFISVKKDVIKHLLKKKKDGGKIIAVGTTSVRTLESLYYIGELLGQNRASDLKVGQWQPYKAENNIISIEQSLSNILSYLDNNNLSALIASTQIIITPGYEFKVVDGIITNFHQPKSTLLLLISAFISGNRWKSIYLHALEQNYRFLSYGDSSLLLKE